MKKDRLHITLSKQLKAELHRYAKERGMSVTGLLLVSVAGQHPELKDAILRDR